MLNDVLSNEITVKIRKQPYRHIVVDNLFNKKFYKLLCKEFDDRLALGFSEKFNRKRFWKFGHYDAYCWSFDPAKDSSFTNVFYSPEWRFWVNKFFNLKVTNSMIAEFHHHKPNSASGYIHSDYDVASFMKAPLPNGINPHTYQIDYRGRTPGADLYCVRSLAMLYYFNNPVWEEGDGGETAMFESFAEGSEPAVKVAPKNNRLLAFEISPKSYHAFIQNKKNIRNCLVMWFHSTEAYVTARYGEPAK